MRKYIAVYKGKQIEVEAMSSFAAQKQAAVAFKAKKSYDVTVMLTDVVHSTAEI
jgi:hypothetical protein